MTQADKANEGREEKTEGELLEEALIHIDGLNEQIESLRDQLSKEREKVKQLQDHIAIVDKSIQSAGELYEKNLKKEREDNKNLSSLLNGLQNKFIKERDMRKELVKGLESLLEMLQPFKNMEAVWPLESFKMREIESLIAKATELDKK